MLSSLAKSIALTSLFATQSALAFTPSSLPGARQRIQSSSSSSSSSRLHNSYAEEEHNYNHNLPHQSYVDSLTSQEDQLNSNGYNDWPQQHQQQQHQQHYVDQSSMNNNNGLQTHEPRSSEFHNLEDLIPTPIRTTRLESEARISNIYVPSGSDNYWDLRDEIEQLERDLSSALEVGVSDTAVSAIRSMLRRAQARDPEHVYRVTSGAAKSAERMGRMEESERYREESVKARRMLPQFNLEGLWVGKYGSHGFEMINVTYSGDELIAYKVTGDQNIPRGEISFTADLSPYLADELSPSGQMAMKLDPIELSDSSAKKWGTKRLPRFPGQGHAAEPGFVNHQYMEGQLVVIGEGDYFSFAWVPLEHQIFFGRPSPELTLKMLREGGGSSLTAGVGLDVPGLEAGLREQTDYVSRCLEVTSDTLWDERNEGKVDPYSCIWHGDDDEYCYFE